LSYPHEEEYVNIRIYRDDRDRLAATMKYGDTMAEKIHTLIERVASEDQP
jgi:predicted RNA-binding protein (virulence factor B family)